MADQPQTTECPVCLGGAVTSAANDLGGFLVCRRCGGTGKIIIKPLTEAALKNTERRRDKCLRL